jgi:hypothetical protein
MLIRIEVNEGTVEVNRIAAGKVSGVAGKIIISIGTPPDTNPGKVLINDAEVATIGVDGTVEFPAERPQKSRKSPKIDNLTEDERKTLGMDDEADLTDEEREALAETERLADEDESKPKGRKHA